MSHFQQSGIVQALTDTGTLNRTEPSLMLSVTPVPFLLWVSLYCLYCWNNEGQIWTDYVTKGFRRSQHCYQNKQCYCWTNDGEWNTLFKANNNTWLNSSCLLSSHCHYMETQVSFVLVSKQEGYSMMHPTEVQCKKNQKHNEGSTSYGSDMKMIKGNMYCSKYIFI